MRNAVIVDAVRTPIGRGKPGIGALSGVHPVDLSAVVLGGLVDRVGLDPAIVDDVIWGCVTTIGEQSSNVGRWALLAAGWPETVPATTIDRACGSSQQAIAFAAAGVMSGQYDVVVAGGVESMSRVPMGSTRTSGHGQARGPQVAARYGDVEFSQGIAAEMLAERWNLSRSQCDEFAAESHARAERARAAGLFEPEIVGVPDGAGGHLASDEGIRPGSNVESLSGLRPVFRPDGGVVTAGNSSQISDGASAVLVMAEDVAKAQGYTPIARFVSFAVTAVDPVLMLTGPISATHKALAKAGLRIDDIGVFEVNEAFATVNLAWLAETGADPALLNPHGGAIALGHPLGASGARLTTSLVHQMRATDARFGLQTICEAGGMANAYVLEQMS